MPSISFSFFASDWPTVGPLSSSLSTGSVGLSLNFSASAAGFVEIVAGSSSLGLTMSRSASASMRPLGAGCSPAASSTLFSTVDFALAAPSISWPGSRSVCLASCLPVRGSAGLLSTEVSCGF